MSSQASNTNIPTAPPGMPNPGLNNPFSVYVPLVFDGDHFLYARRNMVALRFGIPIQLTEVMEDGIIPIPGLDKREAHMFLHWINYGQFRLMPTRDGQNDAEKRKCFMIECISLYGVAMRYDLQDLARVALAHFSHLGDQIGVKNVLIMFSEYAFAGEGGETCIVEYTLRRCPMGQSGFLRVPHVFQVRESYGMEHTIASVLLQLEVV
ncbi:hypothetical protein HG530_001987 [Fusarium avenaceum]|nr:hypothetical protein HG530_001987 [Fusarium avenaceum]